LEKKRVRGTERETENFYIKKKKLERRRNSKKEGEEE
jgi:hypothetical protein